MIGFRVRGLRSSAQHPDATDWTAFCWGLTRGVDHFAFGFPVSKRRQVKSICGGTFPIFMPLLPQPSLMWVKGSVGKRALNSSKKARLPATIPEARRSRGPWALWDRSSSSRPPHRWYAAASREIPIFGRNVSISISRRRSSPARRLNRLPSPTRRSNDRSETSALGPTKVLFQRWDPICLTADMSLRSITSPERAFCRHSPRIFYSRLAGLPQFLSRYLQPDCRRPAVETLSSSKRCTSSRPQRLRLPHCSSR